MAVSEEELFAAGHELFRHAERSPLREPERRREALHGQVAGHGRVKQVVYPHRQPVTVVIGAPITTTDIGAAPSRSQVRQKLDEVVNAMETLYYEHRAEHGDERLELRIE